MKFRPQFRWTLGSEFSINSDCAVVLRKRQSRNMIIYPFGPTLIEEDSSYILIEKDYKSPKRSYMAAEECIGIKTGIVINYRIGFYSNHFYICSYQSRQALFDGSYNQLYDLNSEMMSARKFLIIK